MLFRDEGDDAAIAISQPAHAWLSGRLARVWGNNRFARPEPREEVCAAAALHDVGWLDWEAAPTLDRGTGRPHDFRAVPKSAHGALWREGVRRARLYGRVPALLVSLHAETIYGLTFDPATAPRAEAAEVQAFLEEQRAVRGAILASLRADPDPAVRAQAAPEAVEANRLLVAAVDRLSLEICWGVRRETRIPNVPASGGERVELVLAPADGAGELVLDPWPFGEGRVGVGAEGRRLRGRFPDEDAMRRALEAEAGSAAVAAVLRPRG